VGPSGRHQPRRRTPLDQLQRYLSHHLTEKILSLPKKQGLHGLPRGAFASEGRFRLQPHSLKILAASSLAIGTSGNAAAPLGVGSVQFEWLENTSVAHEPEVTTPTRQTGQ
jgi:hypothetical protein